MPDLSDFFGLWQLEPERCDYEIGPSPASGTYEIIGEGQRLTFVMKWVTKEGAASEMSYGEICDGAWHEAEHKDVADELRLGLEPTGALVSEAKKGGEVVMHAARELLADGGLKVTMSGPAPDGGTWRNVSFYVRAT